MSNFALEGSLTTEDPVRLTDNTVTNIYTAVGSTPLSSVIVAPNSGTPTCTLYLTTSGGTARVIWSGTAPFIFAEYLILSPSYKIQAQSSDAAGKLDITVTHGVPAAARQRV